MAYVTQTKFRGSNYGLSAVIDRTCSLCGSKRFYASLAPTHANGVRYRCKDCERLKARRWLAKNPDKEKASRRRYNRRVTERRSREHWLLKLQVFMEYGGSCFCCGEGDLRFLTLDHLNGGGAQHRRDVGSKTYKVYEDVLKQGCPKDKFQVLCWNCHMATRYGSVCPHKEDADGSAVA